MSPNAAKITSGLCGDRQTVVDAAHRQNADGAAGTVNQLNIGGKNVLQAEPIDRVRVPAANFHEAIVAIWIGEAANFFRGLLNQFWLRNSSTYFIATSIVELVAIR